MKKDLVDNQEFNSYIEQLQNSHGAPDLSFKVPLKVPPKYGAYLWWPAKVEEWVHPDDHDIAYQLIPSNRIFKREDIDGGYALLSYGSFRLRVRPAIWLELRTEGYEVGDQVEVKSRMGCGRPFVARIEEVRWENENRRIRYWLSQSCRHLRTPYTSDEFQLAMALESHMTERKLKLMDQARFR